MYRTLALLTRRGLVEELRLSEEHHHYEARSAKQHYHLRCTECGAVEEFSADPVAYLKEALLQERGFAVTALQLDIAGMCRRCRDQGVAT